MSQISPHLIQKLQKLESQVKYASERLDAKAKYLTQAESKVRQGQEGPPNAKSLERNLKRNMGNFMIPGNVGDINKVIWPFFFSTDVTQRVTPGSNVRSAFTVTQEASFVCMNYIKTVYVVDDTVNPEQLVYVDADNPNEGSPGLSYLIRDAVSSREFFAQPQSVDQIGNPRFPFVWPTPQIFLPNSSVEVNFFNENVDNIYEVTLTFFGYRMRFEGDQRILSTIRG